mmetsp:Transcript_11558/g.32447  ORF Transcript_11558/g.32447 Transcript_11558/m.32447 type:complete len:585 (+) Transcript_11558:212-1966(+)|eukprot:CAMPEP_0119133742 /NCGR_PEP_ID=MMETSP1310-20130426/13528_1 /TAXON_ID=464262 /ORGANISM="Genus nov. species nov., Strain RCC2339" /LENGTH=584 /DNA_ID=CAMNT_0007124443 /DNA_START=169 /DNA_END=1923 /DNA_ORIENTATION=-
MGWARACTGGLAVVLMLMVALVTVTADEQAAPHFARRGYFSGRSGNVMVLPATMPRAQPSVFVVEHYHQRHGVEAIDDSNIANYVSHVFQTAPPSNEKVLLTIDRSAFPALSLFRAPAANVFAVVEGVDRADLEKYPTLALLVNQKQVQVHPTYYHRDSLSSLETALSSVTPSKHGITGRSWINHAGLESMAFSDPGSGSHAESLFDSLAMTTPGAFLVSMSADEQFASAMGLRVPPHMHKALNMGFYWNSKHQTFDLLDGSRLSEDDLMSNRACILTFFERGEKDSLFDLSEVSFAFDEANMRLTVAAPRSQIQEVPFDFTSEEDFLFFAEIHFLELLLSKMGEGRYAAYVLDGIPDSYAFAFSGVNSIRSKYGRDSLQYHAAIFLLDSALSKFLSQIDEIYAGHLSHQVLFLHAPPVTPTYATGEVLEILDDVLPSAGDVRAYLPDIFLESDLSAAEQRESVEEANTFLAEYSLAAYWFGSLHVQTQDLILGERSPRWTIGGLFGGKGDDGTKYCYTVEQVNLFQITFWTSIALILLTMSASCVMCMVFPEKNNELLYRQTALRRETDTIQSENGEYDFKPL